MRHLWLVLIIPTCLIGGCGGDKKVDGWNTADFAPHEASSFHATPGGHLRDAGPFASVSGGFVTDAEIDAAVDDGYAWFQACFPEFDPPTAKVSISDDYVMYVTGAGWAGGVTPRPDHVMVCLWSRGTSAGDPGAQYIKRAPDANYSWWRFTAGPLCPAIPHELLHTRIGDPGHGRPEWARLDVPRTLDSELAAPTYHEGVQP